MTEQYPSNSPKPASRSHSPGTGLHKVVRRARLEHLAAELLRAAQALRAPVPVEMLLQQPPLGLWPAATLPVSTNAEDTRLALARLVARRLGESQWALKRKIFGDATFTDPDADIVAVALLLPSPLIANLNDQQRSPANIAHMFQVPERLAIKRLKDLGYASAQILAPNTVSEAHIVPVNDATQ